MRYTIIFLVEEESDDFAPFFRMINDLFSRKEKEFEIIVVANATGPFVKSQIGDKCVDISSPMVIAFHRRVPSAACLNAALNESRGEIILTLSPYQELLSESYETLIDSLTPETDLVIPFRKRRHDPFLNKLHSKLLNLALKLVVGEKVHDIGCNAKLFRRQVLEDIDIYGNMLKYLPSLAAQKGFKVKEIECEQQEKARKTRFYSSRLYLNRLVEITNLFFSTNFSKKPLRFFSLIGSGFVSFGVFALLFVGIQKMVAGVPIGNRPLLMVAIISIVAGAQFASFGLLGEIISFVHGRSRREYTIEEIIE